MHSKPNATMERQIGNITEAIKIGGDIPNLVDEMKRICMAPAGLEPATPGLEALDARERSQASVAQCALEDS
jgi:hypothetical protein